jgi:hypothetical protein
VSATTSEVDTAYGRGAWPLSTEATDPPAMSQWLARLLCNLLVR